MHSRDTVAKTIDVKVVAYAKEQRGNPAIAK